MRIRTAAEAIAEGREARKWYRLRSRTAERQFSRSYQRTRARIGRFPQSGSPLPDGVRSALVADYPYAIIYRVMDDHIQIVALAHSKREPGYWQRRLDSPPSSP